MHAAMGKVLPRVWDTDFAAIVREHAPTMRTRLRKAGLFVADIDDCLQDAFVKAWQLCDQMPSGPEKRGQWLGRIAFNASYLRRRELRRTHYIDGIELAERAGESRSNTEAPAMLSEMLDRLPERYHEIVGLRARGYSIDDIAKHYGIPWNTAKSRWDRACVAMGARGE
jgi:RNA polymerase sigma-70 factor (ECF subfamily)